MWLNDDVVVFQVNSVDKDIYYEFCQFFYHEESNCYYIVPDSLYSKFKEDSGIFDQCKLFKFNIECGRNAPLTEINAESVQIKEEFT